MEGLGQQDPAVGQALRSEENRQKYQVELIASENYVSRAVLEALGSIFTNKTAEGYPGRRYYAGCENVDTVESLAIERARQLFGAEHVNVQPHSGSQANMAAYLALIRPGDKIMGMSLSHGGHLTHGSPVNFSGLVFQILPYYVDDKTDLIDYETVERQAREAQPNVIVCGATAYPRFIDFERFRWIADQVGAYLVADIAHIAGMVAVGLHPSPISFAHITTTTTYKSLRGPRGGMIMCKQEFANAVDKAVFPGVQGSPHMHTIAAKAVALGEALRPDFKVYQANVLANAARLSKVLTKNGIRVVSGGTDNHLLLVDVSSVGMTGLEAETVLHGAGITVNKNTIPGEKRSPREASGIRIGMCAVTTRGFGLAETDQIGQLIATLLLDPQDENVLTQAKAQVHGICQRFPVPAIDEV